MRRSTPGSRFSTTRGSTTNTSARSGWARRSRATAADRDGLARPLVADAYGVLPRRAEKRDRGVARRMQKADRLRFVFHQAKVVAAESDRRNGDARRDLPVRNHGGPVPRFGERAGPVSWFGKIKTALARTREAFGGELETMALARRPVDDDLWDDLEEILLKADFGMPTTTKIVDALKVVAAEARDDLIAGRVAVL